MSGVEFDLIRYYVESGKPTEERITFRDVDRDDARARPIAPELLALAGAEGIDRAWVWVRAERAGFDQPQAIIVGEQIMQTDNGPETYEQRVHPDHSEYWDVLNLPARPGVKYISKDEYDLLVIAQADENYKAREKLNVDNLERAQKVWDITRKLHAASDVTLEETIAVLGPRPKG